eukprot:11904173-Ditylum_brightwellii.AAC.1
MTCIGNMICFQKRCWKKAEALAEAVVAEKEKEKEKLGMSGSVDPFLDHTVKNNKDPKNGMVPSISAQLFYRAVVAIPNWRLNEAVVALANSRQL